MAAARTHTFADFATAIDDAFSRWDRAHLHQFSLGDQFIYEFDFGDSWHHLCAVDDHRIDTLDALGIIPDKPMSRAVASESDACGE
jgi:hypothetical protein